MAKLLFLKCPRELKGEFILLCRSKIATLSSLLRDTEEAIKRLIIKGGGVARRLRGVTEGDLSEIWRHSTRHLLSGSFGLLSRLQQLTTIICVVFGRERRTVSVNCLLNTSSGRTYLSGDVAQSLALINSVGLDCYLRLTTLLGSVTKDLGRWFWTLIWDLVLLSTLLSWWPTSWTYLFS